MKDTKIDTTNSDHLLWRVKKALKGRDFDYSKFFANTQHDRVNITCNKHGPFTTNVQLLLRGSACNGCRFEAKTKTTEQFKAELFLVYGDRLTLAEGEKYILGSENLNFICKDHGEQSKHPSLTLGGKGCRNCYEEGLTLTQEEFLTRVEGHYGPNAFTFDGEYQSSASYIGYTCLTCGHSDSRRAGSFLRGNGCPGCVDKNFKGRLPATLYWIKAGGNYKIGITNYKDVRDRYKKEDIDIEVLEEIRFDYGITARTAEQHIVAHFAPHRYEGLSPFKHTKTTEMFSKNIFKYITLKQWIAKNGY